MMQLPTIRDCANGLCTSRIKCPGGEKDQEKCLKNKNLAPCGPYLEAGAAALEVLKKYYTGRG